jgi:hypothetical protein
MQADWYFSVPLVTAALLLKIAALLAVLYEQPGGGPTPGP